MAIDLPDVSDNDVRAVVAQINSQGFGLIPKYIDDRTLAEIRRFVDAALIKSGGECVSFNGLKVLEGSILEAIAETDSFKDLMRRMYAMGASAPVPPVEFYLVLRCLSGKSAIKHCLRFHYDSYVVTALIAVEVPKEGKTGDLIMLPNVRQVRRSYFENVLDKLLLDNNLTQAALKYLWRVRCQKFTRIRLVPGNIYFFWGYRSIHTNDAFDEDKVRATALFHYANPHANSGFYRWLKISKALFSQQRRSEIAPGFYPADLESRRRPKLGRDQRLENRGRAGTSGAE